MNMMKKRKRILEEESSLLNETGSDINRQQELLEALSESLQTNELLNTEHHLAFENHTNDTYFNFYNPLESFTLFEDMDAILKSNQSIDLYLKETAPQIESQQVETVPQIEDQQIDYNTVNEPFNISLTEEDVEAPIPYVWDNTYEDFSPLLNREKNSSSLDNKIVDPLSTQQTSEFLSTVEVEYKEKNDLSKHYCFKVYLDDSPILLHDPIHSNRKRLDCSYNIDPVEKIISIIPRVYLNDKEYTYKDDYLKKFGEAITQLPIKDAIKSVRLYYNNTELFYFAKDSCFTDDFILHLVEPRTENPNPLTSLVIYVTNPIYTSISNFYYNLRYHITSLGLEIGLRDKVITVSKLDILDQYELEEKLFKTIKEKAAREMFSIDITKKYKDGSEVRETLSCQPDRSNQSNQIKLAGIKFFDRGNRTQITQDALIMLAQQAIGYKHQI